MPSELWQIEEHSDGAAAVQAFVFDGWSHEPLVIDTSRRMRSPTKASQREPLIYVRQQSSWPQTG